MPNDEAAPPTSDSEGEAPPTPNSEEEAPTPSSEREAPARPNSEEKSRATKATTRKPRTLPQSDWHFAFGPQKWYWVRIGDAWRFTRSNKNDWDISKKDPRWIAFKHTTGFFTGGRNDDGEPEVYHSWNDGHLVRADEVDDFVKSRDAYQYLHEWLDAKQLNDTSVSIGPKGSYFARCGSTWISHELPKDLLTKLERNKDEFTPIHVALGRHGSWIVVWSDGDVTWNLRNSYPTLAQSNALTDGVGPVVFAALNAYEEDEFFVAGEQGCSFNANLSSMAECKSIQVMIDDYMRMRAKRDNTTFNYPVKIDGRTRNVSISPTSYESRGASILETLKERRSLLLRKDNMALIGAGAVATGVLSRMSGASPLRATGTAVAVGVGGAFAYLYGVRNALRDVQSKL